MSENLRSNMISGFRTCGIVPVNREIVKEKLQFNQVEETPENSEVIQFLQQQRGIAPEREAGSCGEGIPGTSAQQTPKRKRSNSKEVTPGRPAIPENIKEVYSITKTVRAISVARKKIASTEEKTTL